LENLYFQQRSIGEEKPYNFRNFTSKITPGTKFNEMQKE